MSSFHTYLMCSKAAAKPNYAVYHEADDGVRVKVKHLYESHYIAQVGLLSLRGNEARPRS